MLDPSPYCYAFIVLVFIAAVVHWNHEPRQVSNLDALTGIRFPIPMIVVAGHVGLIPLSGSGLFIVLSALILNHSRLKKPPIISSLIDYRDWVVHRLARVMPLYWALSKAMAFAEGGFSGILQSLKNPQFWFLCVDKTLSYHWFIRFMVIMIVVHPILEILLPKGNGQGYFLWYGSLFCVCALLKCLITVHVHNIHESTGL
eukprot:gnl/MRDRNA2_/MRDRNA2_123800_c0_seq1.p1 gnl/MRDRNA2_/MRDRNA2_123800_c0~~gnl/MRDRNA2_/MRDRNA2_123800_c0_seq1.p1  ORF type:complete len:201 (+),score=9.79 gnl/MRDRNA2_/MRDRNA2_123800_c0_seq1:143-745(+)